MRFYLTTPIYYVNATPSIGNAYTTIAADVVVRHHRQRGDETFFLTGTDENASRVYRVAEEAGIEPKAFVDDMVEKHWRELPKQVNVEYDFFIRTTDEGHKRFVQEFSVSRAGQPWGVPIPWDEEQVTYVWVDALINYLSALSYAREDEDLREKFWPHAHHVLGKDILRFHCVYWPALLLSAGYEVPQQLFVHGYLLLDDRKISKSLGNVIDPLELIDVYGADAVRFWCARAVSFGQDGSASLDGLQERYERELGNDLGNLLSRTTAMIARYRGGTIVGAPSPQRPFDADALRDELTRLF